MTTPNTGIPYVPENTQDPAAGLNLALNTIDALLQTAVIDMGQTAPPGSPNDGDLHIVGTGATGAWAGQDNNLARYVAEGDFWQFYDAGTQVRIVLNLDDGGLYAWTGSTWAPVAGGGSTSWGSITGTLSDQTDLQSALNAKADNAYTIVTEASAFTAAPGTHDGLTRLVLAGGDVTFDNAEPYTSGMTFNIRATAPIELVEDGVTLAPPAGGTLELAAGMAVQVVFTSSTTAVVIGQTVASS